MKKNCMAVVDHSPLREKRNKPTDRICMKFYRKNIATIN
jgi:hypothetical protein